MLKNEKLITTLSFIVVLIGALDTLFVFFNNHMWPILNVPTFEIYFIPFLLILCFACYNFPNIRNNKYILFPVYIIIALNLYGIISNVIN